MSDAYLAFSNSRLGSFISSMLGLPQPQRLRRFRAHQPVIEGELLVGAGPRPQWLETIAKACAAMQCNTVAHDSLPNWTALANAAGMMSGRWAGDDSPGARVAALLFDASGLACADDANVLYRFLHDTIRSVRPSGRILVLGRVPEACADPVHATMQRALEGLIRSVGREARRGIGVQLVQLDKGAESMLEGALRFLLSPRSAYVSGQVLALHAPAVDAAPSIQWDQPLSGRTLLVTGAARGIGEAIAEVLVRDGARLVCLDVPQTESALGAVCARLGAQPMLLDIAGPDAPATIAALAREMGGWDGVIHNAGITRDRTIARMRAELWQQVIDVNLQAPLRINDALLQADALKAGSRVVCLSSISGIAGNAGQTNYAFSKAGLIGLVRSHAPAFAQRSMAINAVAPGFIETAMTATMPFAIREAGRRMNGMSQGGLPVDVAEAVAWLASPAAAGMNGGVLRVCGQSLLGA
jgi:3-oxoacyl-[acyl-carrier protein] reductase